MREALTLLELLKAGKPLTEDQFARLVTSYTPELAEAFAREAVAVRQRIYGKDVYVRGLIEISNFCKNDCYYCGIRRGNRLCERYRLTPDEILECCEVGYDLGFRTFVMQGGEDPFFTDEVMCDLITRIKTLYPDCAITLSLGERSEQSYRRMFEAGADRYLLRHETADADHYQKLHPLPLTLADRMDCLHTLRKIGYQVGCGFMVGSPHQTPATIAKDLAFIQDFRPDMCGIGPFLPHKDTPFREEPAGSADLTCFLLSVVRLIHPPVLLPATTALGTAASDGRERGVLSGANVVMPNLSPLAVRKKYALYDNKISTNEEAAEGRNALEARMQSIGYRTVVHRGDVKPSLAPHTIHGKEE